MAKTYYSVKTIESEKKELLMRATIGEHNNCLLYGVRLKAVWIDTIAPTPNMLKEYGKPGSSFDIAWDRESAGRASVDIAFKSHNSVIDTDVGISVDPVELPPAIQDLREWAKPMAEHVIVLAGLIDDEKAPELIESIRLLLIRDWEALICPMGSRLGVLLDQVKTDRIILSGDITESARQNVQKNIENTEKNIDRLREAIDELELEVEAVGVMEAPELSLLKGVKSEISAMC